MASSYLDIYRNGIGSPGSMSLELLRNRIHIISSINRSTSVCTSIQANDKIDWIGLLRISLVLSDVTILNFGATGNEMQILVDNRPEDLHIKCDPAMAKDLGLGGVIRPMTRAGMSPPDKLWILLDRKLGKLIHSGSLVLMPTPKLLVKQDGVAENGGNRYKLHDIDLDILDGVWSVVRPGEVNSMMPMRWSGGNEHWMSLAPDLVVPFLRGVPVDVLVKILEDESDHLGALRSSIRSACRKLADGDSTTQEYLDDEVVPVLHLLERRFKKITNSHVIRAGGASVCTVSVGLAALAAGLPAGFAALAGPAGLGYLTKEFSEMSKERDELKEHPLYPLWRIWRKSIKRI